MKPQLIYWIKWEREQRPHRYEFDHYRHFLETLDKYLIEFGPPEILFREYSR